MAERPNGRDSHGQRREVKKHDGQHVVPGNVIIRQVGTRVHPGRNVAMGRDYTIFATAEGKVKFSRLGRDRKKVSVIPLEGQVPPPKTAEKSAAG